MSIHGKDADVLSHPLAISYLGRGELAHVELCDLLTNAAGKSEAELTLDGPGGDDLSEAARSTSSGYVHSKLTVLHGGAGRAPAAEFKPAPAKAGGARGLRGSGRSPSDRAPP